VSLVCSRHFLVTMISSCCVSLIRGSRHFLVESFICLVCSFGFSHRFCHREWLLILKAWITSLYITYGYNLVSEDHATFIVKSSESSLPGMLMCDGTHISLIALWFVFWMVRAWLNFVCMLEIKVIPPKIRLR